MRPRSGDSNRTVTPVRGQTSPVRATVVVCAWCLSTLAAGLSVADVAAVAEPDVVADAESSGDLRVKVVLDPSGQSGSATATVRIHASRETVWSLITSCPENLRMVPGLMACNVLETAPDGSSQKIRHVLHYSWLLPRLSYDLLASYEKPARAKVERMFIASLRRTAQRKPQSSP